MADRRIRAEDGQYYIPASQRLDGSWRKARRVKTGYVPQEEVPKYQIKGKLWGKERATYPISNSPQVFGADQLVRPGPINTPVTAKTTIDWKSKMDLTKPTTSATVLKSESPPMDGQHCNMEMKYKSSRQNSGDIGRIVEKEQNQQRKFGQGDNMEKEVLQLENTLDRFKLSSN